MRFYTLALLSGLMVLGLPVSNEAASSIVSQSNSIQLAQTPTPSTNSSTGAPYRGSGRLTTASPISVLPLQQS